MSGIQKVLCNLVTASVVILLFAIILSWLTTDHIEEPPALKDFNGCCNFPCLHRGVCMGEDTGKYLCDCEATGYYGKRCEIPHWGTWFMNLFKPSYELTHSLVSRNGWLWAIVNQFYCLRTLAVSFVIKERTELIDEPAYYNNPHEYPTVEGIYNETLYARILPPVPLKCPTPMGTKGPKELPKVEVVAEKIFTRTTFKPCAIHTNAMFSTFAQHFTHMFFKMMPNQPPYVTYGHQKIDMSNVYGNDLKTEHALRTFKNGKLKSQMIDGEEYPMFTKHVKISMNNPKNVENVFALGHTFYNGLPMLTMLSTIYLREHNRVATILQAEHPTWEDEKIFQTTRFILLGETMKIVVEDYIQHLSNYHVRLMFDPEITFSKNLQYQSRVFYEYNMMYHWHQLMPDEFLINGKTYSIPDLFYNGTRILEMGMVPLIEALVNATAGMVTHHNHGAVTRPVAAMNILNCRKMRVQPLNQYRIRFGLKPHKTFLELTGGDEQLAKTLEELYQDIDAVELFPGMMSEQLRSNAMFGSLVMEIGSPSSFQGIFGSPISSPKFWRPSTFGGQVGFDIVKKASLKNLFCNNLPSPCPRISFKTVGENWIPVST